MLIFFKRINTNTNISPMKKGRLMHMRMVVDACKGGWRWWMVIGSKLVIERIDRQQKNM